MFPACLFAGYLFTSCLLTGCLFAGCLFTAERTSPIKIPDSQGSFSEFKEPSLAFTWFSLLFGVSVNRSPVVQDYPPIINAPWGVYQMTAECEAA